VAGRWRRAPAQDVLPVPPLSGRVIDQTGTLSARTGAALDAKLAAFEREAGSQIVVLIVPARARGHRRLCAACRRRWKIGRRDVGDGLLIVSRRNDRAAHRGREGARRAPCRPGGAPIIDR
jgi:uncharacterized protein